MVVVVMVVVENFTAMCISDVALQFPKYLCAVVRCAKHGHGVVVGIAGGSIGREGLRGWYR